MKPAESDESLLTVEAWRGVAALMVVVSHWAPGLKWNNPLTNFSFTGVDVFFVISGFVFAPVLWGQRMVHPGGFALRRVMRIYPAYLLALMVYVGLAVWQGRPVLYLPEHLLMAHVQNREMAFYYNPPFWSLPSEVEFYALLAMAAWGLRAGWSNRGWWGLVAVALMVRLALIQYSDGTQQNLSYILLHHLPGLLIEFLIGVWAWRRHRAPWTRRQRLTWAVAGLLGAALCTAAFHVLETGPQGHHWKHGQLGLAMAASFALILAPSAGWPVKGRWPALACQWAGRMSYGTYLLHTAWALALVSWTPSYGVITAALMAFAGLMVSVLLLNVIVEEPARRWARRQARHWESREQG